MSIQGKTVPQIISTMITAIQVTAWSPDQQAAIDAITAGISEINRRDQIMSDAIDVSRGRGKKETGEASASPVFLAKESISGLSSVGRSR